MSCSRCKDLHLRFAIRSPGELAKAIRIVQAHLKDGTLAQMPREGIGAPPEPFLSLSGSGPWDDFLLYAFLCRFCGSRFRLSADTYHGRGGDWLPTDEPSTG